MRVGECKYCGWDDTGDCCEASKDVTALRGKVERLTKALESSCDEQREMLWEASGVGHGCKRAIKAEAALARYRDVVEDVEEIAKMMCFVCCGYPVKTIGEYEPIWKSIGESIKDEWRKRAAAVKDYIRRRAGEGE